MTKMTVVDIYDNNEAGTTNPLEIAISNPKLSKSEYVTDNSAIIGAHSQTMW